MSIKEFDEFAIRTGNRHEPLERLQGCFSAHELGLIVQSGISVLDIDWKDVYLHLIVDKADTEHQ